MGYVARYLFLSVSDIPGLRAVVVTEIPKLVKNEQRILRNRCPGLRTGSQYAIKRCRINIWTHSKYSRHLFGEGGCNTNNSSSQYFWLQHKSCCCYAYCLILIKSLTDGECKFSHLQPQIHKRRVWYFVLI